MKQTNKRTDTLTLADSLNMSAGKRTAFMAAVTTDDGANFDDVTLSKASTKRQTKQIWTVEVRMELL